MLKQASVTIVGAGLMGGSVLKALKHCDNKPKKVTALEIDAEVLRKIKNQSLADIATDDAEAALSDADFVVISLYPAQTIKFIKENIQYCKSECVITDICGVKREVMDTVPMFIPENISYVGGHPMAGREHKGFDYSVNNLFEGCRYIIDDTPSKGRDLVEEFAYTLGAGKIVNASAADHDEMIAYTSQLPHVLAIAYMLCAEDRNVDDFSAGSFRDITRVAMINDEMWSELFCENRDMLVSEITRLQSGLKTLEEYIQDCEIEKLRERMKKAAGLRESIKELK